MRFDRFSMVIPLLYNELNSKTGQNPIGNVIFIIHIFANVKLQLTIYELKKQLNV